MSEFEKYNHHGNGVWVRSALQGRHREFCLCHRCSRLNIGDREANCPTANALFAICVEQSVVTPVWECPNFEDAADNMP